MVLQANMTARLARGIFQQRHLFAIESDRDSRSRGVDLKIIPVRDRSRAAPNSGRLLIDCPRQMKRTAENLGRRIKTPVVDLHLVPTFDRELRVIFQRGSAKEHS